MKWAFLKNRCGDLFTRWLVRWSICMARGLCIVIWSRRIYSLTTTVISKLATLVSVGSLVHRLLRRLAGSGRRCIWVQKFCKARDMIGNRMCGVWGVLLMSCVLCVVRLGSLIKRIWTSTNYSNVYAKAAYPCWLIGIVRSSDLSYTACSKSTPTNDSTSTKSANSVRHTKNIWLINLRSTPI